MSDLVKRSPDPLRAHGAWVYLGLSVLAGLALALPHEPLASLAIGGATVATFVGAGAIACKKRRKRRLLIAAALLLVSLGSLLGSPLEPRGLAYALPALFLLLVTAGLASSRGFFAPSTLACGAGVLALAAPACARAGGAPLIPTLVLSGLLLPCFAWRSYRLRTQMLTGNVPGIEPGAKLGRPELRRIGLREARISALWTLGASLLAMSLA